MEAVRGQGGGGGGGAEGRCRETLREKRGTEEPPFWHFLFRICFDVLSTEK